MIAAELADLDWHQLLEMSTGRTCEAYAQRLEEWLQRPGLDERSRALWHSVYCIVGLGITVDPDAECPFFPVTTYERLVKEDLAPFVVALEKIPYRTTPNCVLGSLMWPGNAVLVTTPRPRAELTRT